MELWIQMSFQMFFKDCDRFCLSDSSWQTVPQTRGNNRNMDERAVCNDRTTWNVGKSEFVGLDLNFIISLAFTYKLCCWIDSFIISIVAPIDLEVGGEPVQKSALRRGASLPAKRKKEKPPLVRRGSMPMMSRSEMEEMQGLETIISIFHLIFTGNSSFQN